MRKGRLKLVEKGIFNFPNRDLLQAAHGHYMDLRYLHGSPLSSEERASLTSGRGIAFLLSFTDPFNGPITSLNFATSHLIKSEALSMRFRQRGLKAYVVEMYLSND